VRQSGLSLIATLWILTILTVLATEFLYSTGLERRIDANFADRTKLSYVAKAGFEATLISFKEDETEYDSLDEDWAQEGEGEIEDPLVEEKTLKYRVKVTDESAKVNLNTADEGVLAGLLQLAGADEETAKELAQAIAQRREQKPFRTVGELAEVEGMTRELLYGTSTSVSTSREQTTLSASTSSSALSQSSLQVTLGLIEGEDEEQPIPLSETLTVHSAARIADPNSDEKPVNITSASSDEISQITDDDGNQIFSQGEAQAIVDYRNQNPFKSIFDLFDVPAVSEKLFDQIRDRIRTDGPSDEKRININTADEGQLASLPGFDEGIAEDVIRYRDEIGGYRNVDQIREAKVITSDEFKGIAGRITVFDDPVVPGLINVNTVPLEILQILPGMDDQKAQAIIQARTVDEDNPDSSGQPFQNLGDLLDVEGFDVETLKQIGPMMTCRSDVFKVEAYGLSDDGKEVGYCMGIVDRTGNQLEIKLWRQR
jgi:general secretion pathway protein K